MGALVHPNGTVSTLSMTWDGRRWRRISSDNVADAFENRLEGVAVTGGRQFAVGSAAIDRNGRTVEQTLIEHRCP